MKTRTIQPAFFLFLAAAALVLAGGCAHHGYGSGDGPNFVKPDNATLPDLTGMTKKMVETLLSSSAFQVKYDDVKKRIDGKLPTLQIGNFDNLVVASSAKDDVRRYTPKLETCRGIAREALQDSGRFSLVEDPKSYGSNVWALLESMATAVESGVDPKNLQSVGNFTAADFAMLGKLNRINDGDSWYFVFEVRLYDLATFEFWTSTKILEKF